MSGRYVAHEVLGKWAKKDRHRFSIPHEEEVQRYQYCLETGAQMFILLYTDLSLISLVISDGEIKRAIALGPKKEMEYEV